MKVLLGIEASIDSLEPFETALERARAAGDTVTIAIVGEDPARADALADRAADLLGRYDLDGEVRRIEGDPGSELVTAAEREEFDRLIVTGGASSPMGKITLGGTAEFVLLNSHVTVTLVR